MAKLQHHKFVWAAFCNKFGLWHNKPLKLYWNEELSSYWARNGNDDFPAFNGDNHLVNQAIDNGYVAFASLSKDDVEFWMSGASSVIAILKNMSGGAP